MDSISRLLASRTIGRGAYALTGIVGFALKYNLDRFVAATVFHRPWGWLSYWVSPAGAVHINQLSRADAQFLSFMLLTAIPFIWLGVVLTVRRLRAARMPVWLVALFFAPVLNLAFFAMLSLVPSADEREINPQPQRRSQRWLDNIMPDSALASAVAAVVLTVLAGAAIAVFATVLLRTYGWGLFVALPFCLGLTSVLLYGYRRPRKYSECVWVSSMSVLLLGGALLAISLEGLICLAMALPIALPLAILGGTVGYGLQHRPSTQAPATASALIVILLAPTLAAIERIIKPPSPVLAVRTSVEIDAPPGIVWHHVVSFAQLPEPREWLFRSGIAYPIRAEIEGRGVGAVRHCVFSTGAFEEPIQIWNEPHLLKFAVTANPPPMQEWTPYRAAQPPHLHGFLVSQAGQFLLEPLAGGRTRLEGTTWYQHHLWPASYWSQWSDYIIHRIHLRVLEHVKQLAESSLARGGE